MSWGTQYNTRRVSGNCCIAVLNTTHCEKEEKAVLNTTRAEKEKMAVLDTTRAEKEEKSDGRASKRKMAKTVGKD